MNEKQLNEIVEQCREVVGENCPSLIEGEVQVLQNMIIRAMDEARDPVRPLKLGDEKTGAIPVAAAQQISTEYGCPIVVVFAIERNAKRFTTVTYGATHELCARAARIGDEIYQAVMSGKVMGK